MSYINRRSKLFMAGQSKLIAPIRSEARLKSYFSSIDARAWSDIVEERRQHILEYTAKNKEGVCLEKSIPIEIILNAMVAGKNIEINKMKKKLRCLEEIINIYSRIELTDEQQRQVYKLRLETEKVCEKLERLHSDTQTLNAVIESRGRLDSAEYSDIESKSKRDSNNEEREKIIDINEYLSTKSKSSRNSNGVEVDKISEQPSIISKSKERSINSRSSNGTEKNEINKSSEDSNADSCSKTDSSNSRSSNGDDKGKMRGISDYSDERSKSKRDSNISGSSNDAEKDRTNEISKETQSTNTESNYYANKLIETDELPHSNQSAYCDIFPCIKDIESECMKKELDNLKSKSMEAEMLKLERDQLLIQLNQLSYLQEQYDDLRLKCSCLESAAQERDVYKLKYDEIISSEFKCKILQSQVDAAKDIESERDSLVKQVGALETCMCKQEEEVKTLMLQVDNLTRNKDEIESHTRDELLTMRDEIGRKDEVIVALEERLPAVQAQLRSSMERVSCKIKCLKTRIDELEGKLGKSQSENEELKRQVRDNVNSMKGAMILIKLEYDGFTTMKGELESAQVENKKLQQIANKMISLTGDDHIKKVLKQSEDAVNRAVEELRNEYKEWNRSRCSQKKKKFVEDASHNIRCRCQGNAESDRDETLKEVDEIEKEAEKLERPVEQTINDDVLSFPPQLKVRCRCKDNVESNKSDDKLENMYETQKIEKELERSVEQTKNDNLSYCPLQPKIRCRCKDKARYKRDVKIGPELEKLGRFVEYIKNGDLSFSPSQVEIRCRYKDNAESKQDEIMKEVNEIQKEEEKLESPAEQLKKDDPSCFSRQITNKCRCKNKKKYRRHQEFKPVSDEIQTEKEVLERPVEQIKNDDLLIFSPQFKTRCRCKDNAESKKDETLKEVDGIQREQEKLERPAEQTKQNCLTCASPQVKNKFRCKNKGNYKRDKKMKQELGEIQRKVEKFENSVEETNNYDLSCSPPHKIRYWCKNNAESKRDQKLKVELIKQREKRKLDEFVKQTRTKDSSCSHLHLKIKYKCTDESDSDSKEKLKEQLGKILREKERLEKIAEQFRNETLSCCSPLLKIISSCYMDNDESEGNEQLKIEKQLDEIRIEEEKLGIGVLENSKGEKAKIDTFDLQIGIDDLSCAPSQLDIKCTFKNEEESESNETLKEELNAIQSQVEKLEKIGVQIRNDDVSCAQSQLQIKCRCTNKESESDGQLKEESDKIQREEEILEKNFERIKNAGLLCPQQLKTRYSCKDDEEYGSNEKLEKELDKMQREEKIERLVQETKINDWSYFPPQVKLKCGSKNDTKFKSNKQLKLELDKVQREKDLIEILIEHVKNNDVSRCSSQLKIICRYEDDAKSSESLDEIRREKEKIEKLVEEIKNDDLSHDSSSLMYTFKNTSCQFTRVATEEDKISERYR